MIGTIFIKANLWWCRYRKFSKLGQYPVAEVLVVTLVTGILCFPNPFTRMNMNELIYLLFSQCSPGDSTNPLWLVPKNDIIYIELIRLNKNDLIN